MYIKQLDGIRCFAIISVLLAHTLYYPAFIFFRLGNIGVDIFFTLSGFLITGILFKEKERIKASEDGNRSISLKYFYARRFLRIFPLYYLTLFICLAINFGPIRTCFGWLVSYSCNWDMAFAIDNISFIQYSHFWSLAVEEQFYIFFPFIILYVASKKNIVRVLAGMIALSVLSRIIFCYSITQKGNASYYSTISCLDPLCLGSLLYSARDSIFTFFKKQNKIMLYGLQFSVILLFLSSNSIFKETNWGIITGRLFTALFTCLLIYHILNDSLPPFINKILIQKPVIYIGKISYGIYILHPLIISAYDQYLEKKLPEILPKFITIVILVFLFSAISWELFEKRILRYKKRFSNRSLEV